MSLASSNIKSYFHKQKLWSLISYQPRWGLTLKGWLLIILSFMSISIFLGFNIYSFLAPVAPIDAEALVVEGWIDDDGIKGAIAHFKQQNYQILITTGTPLGRGSYLSEYKNFAQLSAATAVKLGFDENKIAIVPTPSVTHDRTLASAMAVKQWLQQNKPQIKAINVYSKGVHGRRSWLLYREALNPEMKVGIISHTPISYNARSWWKSSEGARETISEAIAYIYVKFFR
jgi:hypothetical protein